MFLFTGQQERESSRDYKRHLAVCDEGFESQGTVQGAQSQIFAAVKKYISVVSAHLQKIDINGLFSLC